MITTTAILIAKEIVGSFITQGFHKLIKKRPQNYERRLSQIIDQTIDQYSEQYPISEQDGQFPFYKSQIIITELLKIPFFNGDNYELNEKLIFDEILSNPNIQIPTKQDLSNFLDLFQKNLKNDSQLKHLGIDKSYKEEIFLMSYKLENIAEELNKFNNKSDQLIQLLEKQISPTNKIPKELNAIQRRNSTEIIGRTFDILNIRNSFEKGSSLLLISGMAGVGKSTIAEVYTASYYQQYKHLAWLTVVNDFKDAILSSHALIRNLKLQDIDVDSQFEICLNELQNLDGPNLLVIDNASPTLSHYLQKIPQSPNWHTLIISRMRFETVLCIDIYFLPMSQAISLFKVHCNLFTSDQTEQIVKKVDLHTLTIEILSKSATRNRWSYTQVLNALKLNANVGIATKHSGNTKIDKVKTYLVQIFKASDLSENQKWILIQFLALPSTNIEYNVLQNLVHPEKRSWDGSFISELESLYESGFLQKNKGNGSYKLHAVLHEVLRSSLNPSVEDVFYLIISIANLLSIDQSSENPLAKLEFIPFGEAVLEFAPDNNSTGLNTVRSNLAHLYNEIAKYNNSKKLLEQAIFFESKNLGESHPKVAVLKSNLGLVLKELGEYEKGRVLISQALESDLKTYGKLHPIVANRKSNLALLLGELGEYDLAKNLLEEALNSDIQNFGVTHSMVSARQANLSVIYSHLGKYDDALDLQKQALETDISNLGEQHPLVALRKYNLAQTLKELGEYAMARALLEEALLLDIENYGDKHPNVAMRQSGLAQVYNHLGNYRKAKTFATLSLETLSERFGVNHPKVAVVKSILGSIQTNLGEYEGAKHLLISVLDSNLRNFGPKHPAIASSQSNLAVVYDRVGQYEQALDLLENALSLEVELFGKEHPNIAIRQVNLAQVYKNMGKFENARDLLEQSLSVTLKNFGENHPLVASRRLNLANTYSNLNDDLKAYELMSKAMESDIANFGSSHLRVGNCQFFLAHICYKLGKYSKAQNLLTKAYRINKSNLGSEHQDTKTTLKALNDLKRFINRNKK